ncbi:hypothetical protein [Rhodococcus sp. LB1]|uniref:hypothetical protein n=1 Tax=Rhodococcus sp. LB1 TaxID=1807499 RepID=UPI00077B15B5|nr:hypothetical protein [Rhodococcus sp. LB1]KXX59538.1 hypothetical protein AZG88_07245 [Rhodococcus sp. LB1]
MVNTTKNALTAAVRALDEVVIPAIDPGHPLALEQARIVSKLIAQLESRLDYYYDRIRFQLHHNVSLGRELVSDAPTVSSEIADALASALAEGERLLREAGAKVPDLETATERLAGVISALVRATITADSATRDRIERTVLIASEPILDARRAWVLPQGWEPDPSKVPSIETAFAI